MYQQLQAVNAQVHSDKGFTRFSNYLFAKEEMLTEIIVDEVGHALSSFPLCFFMQNEQPCMAALLSVVPQRNLFVSPTGEWLAQYTPSILRAYPFTMGYPTPDADPVLCIDTASLCAKENGVELFNTQGEPSEFVQSTFAFMNKYLTGQRTARKLSADLHAAGLLIPWELSVILEDGKEQKVTGIWQVNEDALKTLSFELLDSLRQSGALALAYAQLWSKSRMDQLQQVAGVHAKSDADKRKLETDMDALFGEGDDSLKFDF